MPDLDDAARAVDILDLELGDLRGPQSWPHRQSRQRRPSLQARHCLGELHDFVGTEHQRQLAGLTSVGDAFWDNRFAKRDVVEKPQCTNDLVQGWP